MTMIETHKRRSYIENLRNDPRRDAHLNAAMLAPPVMLFDEVREPVRQQTPETVAGRNATPEDYKRLSSQS